MRENATVLAKATAPVDLELIFSRALSRVMFGDISDGSTAARKNPSETVMESQLQLLAEQLCSKVERRYRQRFSEDRERDRTETNRRLQQIKEEYQEQVDQLRRQYDREHRAAEDEVKEKEKALQHKFDIKSMDYVNQVEVNRKVLDNRYTEIRLLKEQLDTSQNDFKRKMTADLEMIKLEWERLKNKERELNSKSNAKTAAETVSELAKLQDKMAQKEQELHVAEVRITELQKRPTTVAAGVTYEQIAPGGEAEALRRQNDQLRIELELEKRSKNVTSLSHQEVRNTVLKSDILEKKNNELRIAASVLNEKLKTMTSERNYLREQLRKANERPVRNESNKKKEKSHKRLELTDSEDDLTTGRSDEIEKIRRRIRNLDDIATELDATIDRYSYQYKDNKRQSTEEDEGDYDDFCRHRRASGNGQTRNRREPEYKEPVMVEQQIREPIRYTPQTMKESPEPRRSSTESEKYRPREEKVTETSIRKVMREPSPVAEQKVEPKRSSPPLSQENPLFDDVDPVMGQYMKLVLQSRAESSSQVQEVVLEQHDSTVEITEAGEVPLDSRPIENDDDDIDWSNFMRAVEVFKLIAYVGVLYVLTSVFIAVLDTNDSQVNTVSDLQKDSETGTPVFWQEQCQYLEHPLDGEEARPSHKEYRLRGLAIAFRHGDRSSITQNDDPTGCLPYRDEDILAFENYIKLVNSEEFNYFIRTDKYFKDFPRLPERSICRAGQLTAEGALQHVRLGKFLRERYVGSHLFNEKSELNVTVASTNFNRTFQSSLAFMSTFMFPLKTSVPQVYIKACQNTYICSSPQCECEQAKQWRSDYEEEHLDAFRKSEDEKLKEEEKEWMKRRPFSLSTNEEPFKFIDIALGHYICRHRPLPCADTKCITYNFMSKIINYTSKRGYDMFSAGDKYPAAHKVQLVEAYGLLYNIREMIASTRRFPHSNFIKVLSGHDSSIAPLLRVLGVDFVDPPHYASRVAFEVYDRAEFPNILFVRLVYNGRDVTDQITACSPLTDGMCLATQLEIFARTTILEQLGVKTLDEICK